MTLKEKQQTSGFFLCREEKENGRGGEEEGEKEKGVRGEGGRKGEIGKGKK